MDTAKRITLTWKNGRYFVSEPNIGTCEIVLAADHDRIVGKLIAKISKLEEEVSSLGWQVNPERMGR